MSPRIILVPLNGGNDDEIALGSGFALAGRFGAHVQALFVRPDPRDSVLVLGDGLSTLMVDELIQASDSLWSNRIADARRHFDAAIADSGARVVDGPCRAGQVTAAWSDLVGRPEDQVAAEGRLADLIVFSHGAVAEDFRTYQIMESALLGSGRPVLLAAEARPAIGRSVAVAWDGKLEAGRALAGTLPLLRAAERVQILVVETGSVRAEEGIRLARYLEWYGVAAMVSVIRLGNESVAEALEARARDLGCDLLVMGAYGHSRMREMILGGVTRHIVSHPGLAALLVH